MTRVSTSCAGNLNIGKSGSIAISRAQGAVPPCPMMCEPFCNAAWIPAESPFQIQLLRRAYHSAGSNGRTSLMNGLVTAREQRCDGQEISALRQVRRLKA